LKQDKCKKVFGKIIIIIENYLENKNYKYTLFNLVSFFADYQTNSTQLIQEQN